MLEELVIIKPRHLEVVFRHDGRRVVGVAFAFLLFLVVDVGFDDLHVGHDGDHLLLGEQAVGLKAFVLATACGRKDKA